MIETVYNKDNRENIKMFKDLDPSKEYSNYSVELNRVFGEKTYCKFQKKLIENRKIRNNNFIKMFQKTESKNRIIKSDGPFNISKFSQKLKEMKEKTEKLEYKLKHPREFIPLSPYQQFKERLQNNSPFKKLIHPKNPDIGKYNPCYDICRKHSFVPCFAAQNFEEFNRKNNNYQKLAPIIPNSPRKYNSVQRGNIFNNRNKQNEFSVFIKTELDTTKNKYWKNNNYSTSKKNYDNTNISITENLNSTFGDEKNNHCIKFSSYTPRKSMIKEIIYNTDIKDEKINYWSPKYLKGNVEFNKNSTKVISYFDKVVKNSTNPPLGSYHPNYDSVLEKTVDVFLDKKQNKDKAWNEKLKLQKLLHSYNVGSDYKMVTTLNDYKPDFDLEDFQIKKVK